MNYIYKLSIDENALVRGMRNKRERDLVIADLLEANTLIPHSAEELCGPYSLNLAIVNNKILLDIEDSKGNTSLIESSIVPLRRIIKDYSIICASYFDTVKNSDPRKVEAIDMGRRSAHNDGAEVLLEQLEGKVQMDFETARKLFALIYFLQEK